MIWNPPTAEICSCFQRCIERESAQVLVLHAVIIVRMAVQWKTMRNPPRRSPPKSASTGAAPAASWAWAVRTLERLAASGRIGYIDLSKKSHKRLDYQSLVDFCNRLGQEHRRAPIGARRWEPLTCTSGDEDLLPFPLADTIHAEEACELLGFRRLQPVVRLMKKESLKLTSWQPRRPGASRAARSMPSWKKCAAPSPDHPLRYRLPATSPHF